MEDFYHRLSYSFGNEDWVTEKRALNIQKGDNIVCVTASGDRPLNLLTEDCGSIVAVDANPMQNALLDLKKAAIGELDYEDYLTFLGLKIGKKRLDTYQILREKISQTSDKLWERHKGAIKKGVLFQGSMEKRMRLATYIVQLTRGDKVKRLFAFDNLHDQKQYVQKTFDTPLWRRFIDFSLQPRLTRLFFQDPGLYEYVDSRIHIGHYIHDRLHAALARFPAKESPLLSMMLRGRVDMNHLPPYLEPEGLSKIKPRLDRLRFETKDLITFLENAAENSFDCFSLSDVASYIPFEAFERMLGAVYRCAKPGARFSIRQFLTKYEIPEKMSSLFQRDHALEEKLSQEDRCFVYRFITGTVRKV